MRYCANLKKTRKCRMASTVLVLLSLAVLLISAGCTGTAPQAEPEETEYITITDSLNREITVPANPEKVVCSGPGCLRYLTYLGAQDKIVGVDDIETKETIFSARPYFIANPQFKDYPLIGEFRGNDDPEKIVALGPDVIFKTYVESTGDADELSAKTGVPVVCLNYGDLTTYRDDAYQSLRIMGTVMDKEDRAEDVISYLNGIIGDLNDRTAGISDAEKTTAFIGGIAYRGPHGFQSTEPTYPPFVFVNAANVAGDMGTAHADVAKEKIVEWNPQVLFVDLSTLQTAPNAITELSDDPSYQQLDAVSSGEVYGMLPYNWYTQNHGSIMADAYYIGTVLYPEQFSDIDPATKADEIYTFLVGEPVFEEMKTSFSDLPFTQLEI